MKKIEIAILLFSQVAMWGQVNDAALQRYLGALYPTVVEWNNLEPGKRPQGPPTDGETLRSLYFVGRGIPMVRYIRVRAPMLPSVSAAAASMAQQVASGQMNKMTAGTAGGACTTSLLSSSIAADVLSLAAEYGAINQTVTGNTTTLRANLAGLGGFVVGDPYLGCDPGSVKCSGHSQLARSFSGAFSVENAMNTNPTAVAGTNAATGTSATSSILASGNRMSAWSARYDLQHKTLYDIARYQDFIARIKAQAGQGNEQVLGSRMEPLLLEIAKIVPRTQFEAALQNAPQGELFTVLQGQLDSVIENAVKQNPDFMTEVKSAQSAINTVFQDRDAILRDLQSKKLSVEFNGLHPLGQPNLSNVRVIYSYQPTTGPLLFTFNAAAEWYDSVPAGVKVGRLRDIQGAAQLDRQLGSIPKLGPATLTIAFYYQWMRDSALIAIPAANLAPGTSIVLPGAASTLLAATGPIDIAQAKVTLPIKNGIVKVPISFTWSNRTEFINESEKRGQIGLTLDLDSIFKK